MRARRSGAEDEYGFDQSLGGQVADAVKCGADEIGAGVPIVETFLYDGEGVGFRVVAECLQLGLDRAFLGLAFRRYTRVDGDLHGSISAMRAREGQSCAAATELVAREVAGSPGRGGRATGDAVASVRLRRRRAGGGSWRSPHDY